MSQRCHYTGVEIAPGEARVVGTPLPQSKLRLTIANSAEALQAHKESVSAFHAMDANCNMCKHLVRLPHDRRGLMEGICSRKDAKAMVDHPYAARREAPNICFHPEDYMGMACWEPRK